jgi:hypothetical protein
LLKKIDIDLKNAVDFACGAVELAEFFENANTTSLRRIREFSSVVIKIAHPRCGAADKDSTDDRRRLPRCCSRPSGCV